ncbi:MAG: Gfo/Idh/MocA family oxidoreductase [Bacteroidota bacterium]
MLKIGVFGAGHLGKIHIRLILELKEVFELVGFFDPNDENALLVEETVGIKRFTNAEDLLLKVDCIDIVTPTITHFEIASQALKMHKHVFIEKPITQTVSEAEELLKLATESGVKVQVGHVERFNPAFQAALPFLNKPMFIETHRLAQFNPRGTDVPVVLDLMIHDIDVILSIVKSKVKTISASGVAVVSESDDITNARIEFENGCVANLTSSRISLKNMRKSRFFQKDAYISVDFLTKELEVVRMESIEGLADPFDIVFDMGEGKAKKKVLFDKPDIDESNAIKDELFSFFEAISQNLTPRVSIEDGYLALKVATQILDKVKEAKMVF